MGEFFSVLVENQSTEDIEIVLTGEGVCEADCDVTAAPGPKN